MAEPTASGPGRAASSAPPPPSVGPDAASATAPGPDAASATAPGPDAASATAPGPDAGPRMGSAADPAVTGSVARDAVQEVIDASADFLITGRDYIRQEAEGVVRENIAPPLQEVGVTVASMWAAVTFLILGLIFIGVAAMIFLSQLVGPALAFLIVGGLYLIGAGVFLMVKVRQVRRSAAALQMSQAMRGTGPEQGYAAGTAASASPAPVKKPRKAKP